MAIAGAGLELVECRRTTWRQTSRLLCRAREREVSAARHAYLSRPSRRVGWHLGRWIREWASYSTECRELTASVHPLPGQPGSMGARQASSSHEK